MKLNPKDFLSKLQKSLSNNNFDYETHIDEFGQVKAYEDRRNGKNFHIKDHLRGLILSLLSNQRPWKKIAENIDEIQKIFFNYDPKKIKEKSPEYFIEKVKAIGCGNRAIKKQMESLSYNIDIFLKIESEHGSLDKFVKSDIPLTIAKMFSDSKSEYKLKQVGIPLAFEYLRNVGVDAIKPDSHIMDILSKERLDYLEEGLPELKAQLKAVEILEKLANEINCSASYLDTILWLYCAEGYGEICKKKNPNCDKCELSKYCNFTQLN